MTNTKDEHTLGSKIALCRGNTYFAMAAIILAWFAVLVFGDGGWLFAFVTAMCLLACFALSVVAHQLGQVATDLHQVSEGWKASGVTSTRSRT